MGGSVGTPPVRVLGCSCLKSKRLTNVLLTPIMRPGLLWEHQDAGLSGVLGGPARGCLVPTALVSIGTLARVGLEV